MTARSKSTGSRPTTLVISNIAWDFVWQRHQTLASLFARDSEVVFLEVPGIRRVRLRDAARVWVHLRSLRKASAAMAPPLEGVRIARFFCLPATNAFFHSCNARQVARWLEREPTLRAGVETILDYSASRTALALIATVPHRRLIYDCTDDWLAVRGIPGCLPGDERTLLGRADLTLVPTRTLEERKRPHARQIERVPHGAMVERFTMEDRPRPTDGNLALLYYGHLHAQHLDFSAIEHMARARPQWRVRLVGPVKTPHVFPPNVEVIGQQPHERLRTFIADSDVLLLPYALNDYTRAVMPAKTYECLATGRPIVATPLPELVADFSKHMEFAPQPAAWARAVENAMEKNSAASRAQRIALAQANTWERRYEQIRALIAGLGE